MLFSSVSYAHLPNAALYLPTFDKLVHATLNANLVAARQLPARLFQREALVLLNLFERWRPATPPLTRLHPLEKPLIGRVLTFGHILDGLRPQFGEVRKPFCFLQLRQVLLHPVRADVLSPHPIVSFLHGQAMIPNQTGNIDPLMQVSIPLGFVHAELVGQHHHLPR